MLVTTSLEALFLDTAGDLAFSWLSVRSTKGELDITRLWFSMSLKLNLSSHEVDFFPEALDVNLFDSNGLRVVEEGHVGRFLSCSTLRGGLPVKLLWPEKLLLES